MARSDPLQRFVDTAFMKDFYLLDATKKDEAPIFQVADGGVVADLFEALSGEVF